MSIRKFGFHGGANGVGIPQAMFQELKKLGIPIVAKSTDTAQILFDAISIAGSDLHYVGYRASTLGQKDGYDYDVLPASEIGNKEYKRIAQAHWNKHKLVIPKELQGKNLIVEVVNEVDQSVSYANWLGFVLVELAKLAIADGYRFAAPGYASGNPDEGAWDTPGMIAYFKFANANKGKVFVAVHEYSYEVNNIEFKAPFHIGRLKDLEKACQTANIPIPEVLITEWGWTLNNTPDPAKAIVDIKLVAEKYYNKPYIKGVYIWYLGGGFGGIKSQAEKMIPHLYQEIFVAQAPKDEVPPPPVEDKPMTVEKEVWEDSVKVQIEKGLSLNSAAGLQKAILAFADEQGIRAQLVISEAKTRHGYVMQAAEDGNTGDRYVFFLDGGKVRILKGKGATYLEELTKKKVEATATEIMKSITLVAPFTRPYVITSRFNAPRTYGGQPAKHEGIDLDVPGEPTDSKLPVVSASKGLVIHAGTHRLKGYGNLVIVQTKTTVRGDTYIVNFWYGHNDQLYVKLGDEVERGTPLAELGASGLLGKWEHIHWNIQIPSKGLSGYVVSDVIDPEPWLVPYKSTELLIGLHHSADPGHFFGNTPTATNPHGDGTEYQEAIKLKATLAKVLSAHSPEAIGRLASQVKTVKTWIVRAFLDWGNRAVTPDQFVDWTIADTHRSVKALVNAGVSPGNIYVELHNEPNLTIEGLRRSWNDGREYATFMNRVLTRYKAELGYQVKYMSGGLSPGGDLDIRSNARQFFLESAGYTNKVDAVGIHTYWQTSLAEVGEEIDWYSRQTSKPIFVTEASYVGSNRTDVKLREECLKYAQYVKEFGGVAGVAYYVASGSDPRWQAQSWIVNGQSKGVGEYISQRL